MVFRDWIVHVRVCAHVRMYVCAMSEWSVGQGLLISALSFVCSGVLQLWIEVSWAAVGNALSGSGGLWGRIEWQRWGGDALSGSGWGWGRIE
jgi:hypothetical protein